MSNKMIGLAFGLGIASSAASLQPEVSHQPTLDKILLDGVEQRVFPGVSVMVGNSKGHVYYQNGVGMHKYPQDIATTNEVDNNLPVTVDTWFDMASCTKVISTTSGTSVLYELGYISLEDKLGDIYPKQNEINLSGEPWTSFNSNGKESITVQNCLLHNAGFTPDPVPYWYWNKGFNCPNSKSDYPAMDGSCADKIYSSFINETIVTPPGAAYVYSDISFEALQMVIGSTVWRHPELVTAAGVLQSPYCSHMRPEDLFQTPTTPTLLNCYFETFIRTRVFQHPVPESNSVTTPLMPHSRYVMPEDKKKYCAPTNNDTIGNENVYTNTRLQGNVADGDCYAAGGIAGHAGLFSTARDVGSFLSAYLQSTLDSANTGRFFINKTTIETFTRMHNVTQSSRALGWDTNTDEIATFGYNKSCGTMSTVTFMHTGYTGTCVCLDPVNDIWSVVLTNRAYNCGGQMCPAGSSDAVKAVYKSFHTEAMKLFKA